MPGAFADRHAASGEADVRTDGEQQVVVIERIVEETLEVPALRESGIEVHIDANASAIEQPGRTQVAAEVDDHVALPERGSDLVRVVRVFRVLAQQQGAATEAERTRDVGEPAMRVTRTGSRRQLFHEDHVVAQVGQAEHPVHPNPCLAPVAGLGGERAADDHPAGHFTPSRSRRRGSVVDVAKQSAASSRAAFPCRS